MSGQIRAWSPRYTGKTPEETIRNMETEALGELRTAPDRFMLGLVVGILIGVASFGSAIVLFSIIP